VIAGETAENLTGNPLQGAEGENPKKNPMGVKKEKKKKKKKCLVVRIQLRGPDPITAQSVWEICSQQSGNRAQFPLRTSLPLLMVIPPRFHPGAMCQFWIAE